MCAEGVLIMVLDALAHEAKRARITDDRDQLKASLKELEFKALFVDHRIKDTERTVGERDIVIRERDARIAELRESQQLLAAQLRESEALRKRVPDLEQRLFDATRQNQQLEARLSLQAMALTADFQTHLARAREAALKELEEHSKRLFMLLPADQAETQAKMIEHVDAMRMVVARQLK